MKGILNGKVYDTETATMVYSGDVIWMGNEPVKDETLYLSPKGQGFIYRHYWSGNMRDDELLLLSITETKRWLEKNDAPASAYKALGWEVEEG